MVVSDRIKTTKSPENAVDFVTAIIEVIKSEVGKLLYTPTPMSISTHQNQQDLKRDLQLLDYCSAVPDYRETGIERGNKTIS